jgi:hypothetical protein
MKTTSFMPPVSIVNAEFLSKKFRNELSCFKLQLKRNDDKVDIRKAGSKETFSKRIGLLKKIEIARKKFIFYKNYFNGLKQLY